MDSGRLPAGAWAGSLGREPGPGAWAAGGKRAGSGRLPAGEDTVRGMAADRMQDPVVLSRIYTRTGDDGTTALGDGSRARKTDPRLAAYADVDEANCAIGVALAL